MYAHLGACPQNRTERLCLEHYWNLVHMNACVLQDRFLYFKGTNKKTKMLCKWSAVCKKERPLFVSVFRPPIWKGWAWIWWPDLKVLWIRRAMCKTHQESQTSPKSSFIVFLGGGKSCYSEKFPRFLWFLMNWEWFLGLDHRRHRSPPASQRGSRCVLAFL